MCCAPGTNDDKAPSFQTAANKIVNLPPTSCSINVLIGQHPTVTDIVARTSLTPTHYPKDTLFSRNHDSDIYSGGLVTAISQHVHFK